MNLILLLSIISTAFANHPKINAGVVGKATGKGGINVGVLLIDGQDVSGGIGVYDFQEPIVDGLTIEQRKRISDYKSKYKDVFTVSKGLETILNITTSGDIFLRGKKIGSDSELANIYILMGNK